MFNHPDAHVPTVHVRHSERIGWFDVANNLPRLRGNGDGEQPYHFGPVMDGPSG